MFRKGVVIILLLSPVVYGLRADINGDGRVDHADLSILSEEWLMANKYLSIPDYNYNLAYFAAKDNPALNFGTDDFSMSFWIKMRDSIDTQHYLISKGGQVSMRVNEDGPGLLFTLALYDGTISKSAYIEVNYDDIIDKWANIVFVGDRDGLFKAYVNNVAYPYTPQNMTGLGSITNSSDFIVGKLPYADIDQLLIFRRTLSDAEIEDIYNGGYGLKYSSMHITRDATVVFEMDEGVGIYTLDLVTGILGTISGNMSWATGGIDLAMPPLSEPISYGTLTSPGKSNRLSVRARGVYMAVRLANNNLDETFGFERIHFNALPAGRAR